MIIKSIVLPRGSSERYVQSALSFVVALTLWIVIVPRIPDPQSPSTGPLSPESSKMVSRWNPSSQCHHFRHCLYPRYYNPGCGMTICHPGPTAYKLASWLPECLQPAWYPLHHFTLRAYRKSIFLFDRSWHRGNPVWSHFISDKDFAKTKYWNHTLNS